MFAIKNLRLTKIYNIWQLWCFFLCRKMPFLACAFSTYSHLGLDDNSIKLAFKLKALMRTLSYSYCIAMANLALKQSLIIIFFIELLPKKCSHGDSAISLLFIFNCILKMCVFNRSTLILLILIMWKLVIENMILSNLKKGIIIIFYLSPILLNGMLIFTRFNNKQLPLIFVRWENLSKIWYLFQVLDFLLKESCNDSKN